jgi:micrococcal nuclease
MRFARGIAAVVLVLFAGACESNSSTPLRTDSSRTSIVPVPAGGDATVARVVDGDTIVVDLAGTSAKVRLIGVDTPETKDPRKAVQCFGREASARTADLLPVGTAVRLAYDVERNDRYGRTLAYVYRIEPNDSDEPRKGSFVNADLVRDGYASAYTYPPNVAHADEFVALQREARDAGRGLWGACPVEPSTPTTPTGGACDPAYPDACIPPPPPDLDCGDIASRAFRVLAPDPHHFDSNGDGRGCEGL